MKWFYALGLCLALAGCASGPDAAEVKQRFMSSYAVQLDEQQVKLGIPEAERIKCVDAVVTDKSKSEWTGFAILSNGDRIPIEITIGSDENLVYRTVD